MSVTCALACRDGLEDGAEAVCIPHAALIIRSFCIGSNECSILIELGGFSSLLEFTTQIPFSGLSGGTPDPAIQMFN
jgi:hypothetical protein